MITLDQLRRKNKLGELTEFEPFTAEERRNAEELLKRYGAKRTADPSHVAGFDAYEGEPWCRR